MNFAMKMPPNHHFMLNGLPLEPVSRTYQYRKIMKPMLERKRRARINKCLDELKDLMTGTLQADGENVSKLEKADILELTVRHLHRLRESNALFLRHNDSVNMDKFWAGFQHCAAEVSQFLNKYDRNIGGDLIKYIANFIPNIAATAAVVAANAACSGSGSGNNGAPPTEHERLPQVNANQFPVVANKPTSMYGFNHNQRKHCIHPYAKNNKNNNNSNNNNNKIVRIDEISSDGGESDGDTSGVWRPW